MHAIRSDRKIPLAAAFALAILLLLFSNGVTRSGSTFDEKTRVDRLSPDEKRTYFILSLLMNDLQKKHYLSLESGELRDRWAERFWSDLDPTPTTRENEMREEYERRLSIAAELFGSAESPGWDKRGEMIIRYGMPDFRKITEGIDGFFSKVPPGEVWYYIPYNLLVTYYDYHQDGHYDFSYEPNQRTPQQLVENIDRFKFHLTLNPNELDCIADPEALARAAIENEDVMEEGRIKDPDSDFYRFIDEHQTIYISEASKNPIPFGYVLNTYRSRPKGYDVDITFEIPTGAVQFEPGGGVLRSDIELRASAEAISGELVRLSTEGFETRLPETGEEDPPFLYSTVTLELPPGYFRIGLEVVDRFGERRGTSRTTVELPPGLDDLGVSSLAFADSVTGAGEGAALEKARLSVAPNLDRAFRLASPVHIYFEVYGLETDESGRSSYAVEYRIVPLQKKRWGLILRKDVPDFAGSFERTGPGNDRPVHLMFLTEELWKGDYRLELTVTDTRSWESASATAFFSMIE